MGNPMVYMDFMGFSGNILGFSRNIMGFALQQTNIHSYIENHQFHIRGKSSINRPFSIAMLNDRRATMRNVDFTWRSTVYPLVI